MTRLLPIDVATYEPSVLHRSDRLWVETNCYVDIWIEVLHALGLDPVAGLAFTLSADFDGDQWQFIKFPPEDVRVLYGISASELNPWKGIEAHVEEQLELGRYLTVEVDAWWLPDTAGTSYGQAHVKTTIVINDIDRQARRLGYFHNADYFELDGDDYDHLIGSKFQGLPPYVELLRTDRMIRRDDQDLAERVVSLVRSHLERRPEVNPVRQMADRVESDLAWLAASDIEVFHLYAFATLRQCGATAELAGSLCDWLAARGFDTAASGDAFRRVAEKAKSVQFKLARLMAGRSVDLAPLFDEMAVDWDAAIDGVVAAAGR